MLFELWSGDNHCCLGSFSHTDRQTDRQTDIHTHIHTNTRFLCVCAPQEVEAYAQEEKLLFMETSAKTAFNVVEIFAAIAKKLPKNTDSRRSDGVNLRRAKPSEGKSGGCC